jgi:hypothetical protein
VIPAGGQVLVVAASTGTFYGQNMTAGQAYAIAGGGNVGDGGPAASTHLNDAVDVAFDQPGNLLIADSGSDPDDSGDRGFGSLVRVVAATKGTFCGQAMTAGDIYTVAGGQNNGCLGGGGSGLATSAFLGEEIGSVRPDGDGNLIVTELGAPGVIDGMGTPRSRRMCRWSPR